MKKVIVCYKDNQIRISVNGNGNLFMSSLKTHFPFADGLTYTDVKGNTQNLAVNSEEVILHPKVKKYYVHYSSQAIPQTVSRTEKATEKHGNEKNELNDATNGSDNKCSEENQSNGIAVLIEKPAKMRNTEKTLRIGWLDKAAGGRTYRKVGKPRGGVKKLKLDTTGYYSAHQIRKMAIEAFGASSNGKEACAIEDEYVVNLGDFGGRVIDEFRQKDGRVCDVWDYCKDRNKTLYQLNLFMLTSSIDDEIMANQRSRTISTRRTKAQPRIVNDVRVLYEYVRRSIYSNELSYMECEKPELHNRLLEDHYGTCSAIEHFEPSDYGHSISRIEKSGQVLLQITIDDNAAKSIEFPASMGSVASLEAHSILHDLDRLQGYCNWKFGIGLVPSCNYACQPTFAWYKDGALFKKHEYLYWLDDVMDDQPHRWSCTVTCKITGRQLKSKEISIAGF